jgi:lipopolysaccharide assembly protein A
MTDLTGTPSRPNPIASFLRRRWLALLLAAMVVAFVVQNRNEVSIDVFWISLRTPLWLILIAAVIVGMLIAGVGSRRPRRDE